MNFAAFFSYVFLTALTPGPNNIMSMTNASKYGFKKSFPFNMGVLYGFLIVMSCCATFSKALYGFIPSVKPVMLCIGAAYILWLAWTIWRDKPHDGKKGLSLTNTVTSGMILQFVNVKVILYGITAMSSFVLPYYQNLPIIAVFVLILAVIGFAGTCCWAMFGAAFESFFNNYGKILNVIMALLLVYCAATMILDIWK
ncbi:MULTISPECIES: LysE family transporter [unclassified Clostridium]|uniref:LysE family transporter n=1 Tax=unclassified Clostridium TaxID=2614128 RepID=UPI00023AF914|nr:MULTISPECIES: LysE family transporter [unclassified Clostridium]EHI98690.1 Lysine exporter protein (LYSE/YGGA) [Clostridium sp. DL-VIII]OOM76719.1 cysteine/O-acetylserine efflux protein [Clostridium sp. BL-8]